MIKVEVYLIGENIGYSNSPKIHNEYYKNNNINLYYSILDIKEDKLENFIKRVKKEKDKIRGFNITKPYKEKIIKYLDVKDENVRETGACNLVLNKEGKLHGYNTDIYGFKESLRENEIDLKGKNALILGSGGGAKAVLKGLKDLEANIYMAFRDEAKKKSFKGVKKFYTLKDIKSTKGFDIIINATSLGNINNDTSPVDLSEFTKDTVFYDLNYVPDFSLFLKSGKDHGLKVINGSSMLRLQAMKGIEIWTKDF